MKHFELEHHETVDDLEERLKERVRFRAYYIWQKRIANELPGDELSDWYQAVDAVKHTQAPPPEE
jgi:hypothetical protein